MRTKALLSLLVTATLVYGDQTTYKANAICNNDQLMRFFDSNQGLWKLNGGGYYWWESANMVSSISDLIALVPSVQQVYGGVYQTVFNNAPTYNGYSNFLNDYYDDEGWWGLAWISALDTTGQRQYLNKAIDIWSDIDASFGKPACGGIPWNKLGHGPVSIANELYMALGASLANRVGLDQKDMYLNAARRGWNWLSTSGVMQSNHLFADGLDDNCQPTGPDYTYNQGVILGALVEMWKATGELFWIDTAQSIADTVTAPGSPLLDKNGILADACDQTKSCQGTDSGTEFKGVFVRNLKKLHAVRPSAQYLSFIQTNAQSIWNNDLMLQNHNCLNGVLWGGPYVNASASSQNSALDCLVAALDMTTRGKPLSAAPSYTVNQNRMNGVKEAFNFAWNGYMKYAFPHDSLEPTTNSYADDRNGWGASAIDAFSTAIIMGNQAAVNTILNFIPSVNFDYSATDVSFFETSIRYFAGLLSGYDLLSGPAASLINSNSTRLKPVLSQAKRLADNLKVAYNTPSGININGMNFNGAGQIVAHNDPASGIAGCTLPIEWQRLSDLTGDPSYGNLNKKAVSYFLTPYPQSNVPFPGLIGENFDPSNGHSLDASGGWTGGSDSYYEYLIKSFLYDKASYEKYKEKWTAAADSSIRFLASQPKSRPDLLFLAAFNNRTINYYSEHLACFAGGNFILGGLTLGRQDYVNFGLNLTDGCHDTYASTTTHIGPDSFFWQDIAQSGNSPPSNQASFYQQNGFWINDASYRLRPEVLESYYYAYRATGNTKYQDWSWDAFVHINSTCRTGSGFAELQDVNNPSGGFSNLQDSYFFAEVLKYAYLIHAPDADWQVKADQTNKFVFNTEAHPIRINKNLMG